MSSSSRQGFGETIGECRLSWLRGSALAVLKKYGEALDAFNKAIKLDPIDAAAWYNKGVILEQLGLPDEAKLIYARAAKLDPQYGEQEE